MTLKFGDFYQSENTLSRTQPRISRTRRARPSRYGTPLARLPAPTPGPCPAAFQPPLNRVCKELVPSWCGLCRAMRQRYSRKTAKECQIRENVANVQVSPIRVRLAHGFLSDRINKSCKIPTLQQSCSSCQSCPKSSALKQFRLPNPACRSWVQLCFAIPQCARSEEGG